MGNRTFRCAIRLFDKKSIFWGRNIPDNQIAAQMVQVRYRKNSGHANQNKFDDVASWLVKTSFGLHINYT